tara:strand:- start:127 stop:291 length:165 start_codon:yes stop_codon:yes gene_type:complete
MKKKQNKLTPRQQQTMKKHSKHHSPKHMKMMERLMIKGSSFSAAHKVAMKKAGK